MTPGPLLFLVTFFTMSVSWLSFVLVPQLQIGRQVQVDADGVLYPSMRPGMARQGEQIYRANGCFYCHTEQVRPADYGSDIARGWGGRTGKVQSVAQDYLYDTPVMLGSMRIGPDLANEGRRQTNEMVLLLHLYDPRNPQFGVPGSVMPPYKFLFQTRKLRPGRAPDADALPIQGLAANEEVVPTDDARALVAYLTSLHSDAVLFETPPPAPPPTNAPAGTNAVTSTNAASTNASATGTNLPATNAANATNK
jgi:cytochrome c oxidase cbb3-type subunit II